MRSTPKLALGAITPEQARIHPARNELIQHLGIFEDEMIIEPHFSDIVNLRKGDIFLLCSDGLTGMADDEKMKAVLYSGRSAEEITNTLLSTALLNGGKDNVTVMTLWVE